MRERSPPSKAYHSGRGSWHFHHPYGNGIRHSHPGVTSAIIGPRTLDQFNDLLAGVETRDDEVLD